MSRYIDAEWLKTELGDVNMDIYTDEVKEYINDAPSIDIVFCKECKHWEMRNSPRGWCVVHQGYVLPQYFCADGERREP